MTKKALLITILLTIISMNSIVYGDTNNTNLTANVTTAPNTTTTPIISITPNKTETETPITTIVSTPIPTIHEPSPINNISNIDIIPNANNATNAINSPNANNVSSINVVPMVTPIVTRKTKRVHPTNATPFNIPITANTPSKNIPTSNIPITANTPTVIVLIQTPTLQNTTTDSVQNKTSIPNYSQNSSYIVQNSSQSFGNGNGGSGGWFGIINSDSYDKILLGIILGFIGLVYEVIKIKYEHNTKRDSTLKTNDEVKIKENEMINKK